MGHAGDTLGAGDAFVGGLVAALAKGATPEEALQQGLASAQRNIGNTRPAAAAAPMKVAKRPHRRRRSRATMVHAVTLAASVLIGIAMGWFAASTAQSQNTSSEPSPTAVVLDG